MLHSLSGKFSVFDGMTYPNPSCLSDWKTKLWKTLTLDKQLTIPSHDISQKECLRVFLHKQECILKDLSVDSGNFGEFIQEIQTVFQQLHKQKLCQGNYATLERRIAASFPKVCYCSFFG